MSELWDFLKGVTSTKVVPCGPPGPAPAGSPTARSKPPVRVTERVSGKSYELPADTWVVLAPWDADPDELAYYAAGGADAVSDPVLHYVPRDNEGVLKPVPPRFMLLGQAPAPVLVMSRAPQEPALPVDFATPLVYAQIAFGA